MQVSKAVKFAEDLSVLRFAPTTEAGMKALAKLIAEICADEKQAGRLVGQMLERHDEWPGPATLRQVHSELFAKPVKDETWKGFGPKPKTNCHTCGDLGFHRNRHGGFMLCECASRFEVAPEFLEDLNRRLSPAHKAAGLTRLGEIKAGVQ